MNAVAFRLSTNHDAVLIMPRRLLACSIALAALSVAAGLLDPVSPFEPNRLFVADGTDSVYEFDTHGNLQPTYLTGITQLTGIITAQSLAFGPEGALYVGDFSQDQVLVFDSLGGAPRASVGPGSALNGPTDMVFGPHGDLFVASSMSQEVLRFSRDGLPLDSIGSDTGLQDPRGLAFAPDGHLWVSSYGTDEVLEFDPSGVLVGVHGVGSLDGPEGLAFSPHTGRLYVADYLNDRLVVIGAAGAVLDLIEPESLRGPTSLSFGPDNNLYVASSGSGEILVMNEDGVVDRTMAGGDLGSPSDIAFSPFVFETSVKGRTFPSGAPGAPFKRLARLNWAPGSGRASLLLLDKDGGSDKDPLFGHDALVVQGFESGPTKPGYKKRFLGKELDVSARLDGLGTLAFVSRGVAVNLTGIESLTGIYSPNSYSGSLLKDGPLGMTDAKIKSKK